MVGKVKQKEGFKDWHMEDWVRLDVDLQKGKKADCHVYVPAKHPLARAVRGQRIVVELK